jgi:dihydrofolate synthase/folylpolyglutamate synthase
MLRLAQKFRRRSNEPSDVILERLTRLHPKLIDLSLDRIDILLDRLGRPQDQLPPVVHVAGTNGKGSVIACLRAVLEAAGYRVHAYTSPHLVRFNERIRIAGDIVSEPDLSALLDECERANKNESITYFEITTAAALLGFARTPADILLLECGLGGRFDATNVIARPAATVITPVSMDHMHYLGDTISQIAGEKAAIQKPDTPSVIAAQHELAENVILEAAALTGARPFAHGRDWSFTTTGDGFRYESRDLTLNLPAPALAGGHQIGNAATAVACLEQLRDLDISDTAIREGLPAAHWPGRLQHLATGTLPAMLPAGWELWLDGGHNPAAALALADMAEGWGDRPLYLVFGMMQQKEPQHFLRPLAPLARGLRAIPIPENDTCLDAATLAAAAREVDMNAAASETIESALADIVANADMPGRILICGSLYLAGAALAQNARDSADTQT